MMHFKFIVSPMVILLAPLSDALMHAGQWETLHSSVLMHQGDAADSDPPAPGTTGMWVGKNGDMHRTGSSHSIAPRNLASGPSWRWHAPGPLSGVVRATPLIDEEQNIIESTIDGDIIKFSRDGQQLWKYSSGGELPAVPVLADGAIYTVSRNGTLFSLDSLTGRLLWHARLGNDTGGDTHSVLVTEGVVVAGVETAGNFGGESTIVAASVADGHEVWRLHINGSFAYNFMCAAHNGSIIFEDAYGDVYRVSAIDGAVIWRQPGIAAAFKLNAATTAGVALDSNGNIYAAFNHGGTDDAPVLQGVVKALRFGDGQVLWERSFPLAEANAGVAVGNLDGTRGGALAVFVALGHNPEMPSLFPDAYRTIDGKAVALNAASGETIWELTLPEWRGPAAGDTLLPSHICLPDQFGNPAVDGNGTAYFVRASGRIYALHDDNHDGALSEELGEVSWFDAGDAYQSAPAISDGMLAVSPCDGLMVFLSR